jgi:hypothetical protein
MTRIHSLSRCFGEPVFPGAVSFHIHPAAALQRPGHWLASAGTAGTAP